MTKFTITDVDERLADFCHTASNPRRALLIRILGQAEHTVTELVEATGFSSTNISQHLKLLRDKRIVAVTRQGGYARYRLINTKVLEAMDAMREAFLECLQQDERLRLAEAQGLRDSLPSSQPRPNKASTPPPEPTESEPRP